MRVAFWSTSYFKGVGGAEKVVHDLVNHLDGLGVSTVLIGDRPDRSQALPEPFSALNPRIRTYQDTFPNPLLAKGAGGFLHQCMDYLMASLRLGFFLRRQHIDVMHLHLVNIDVLLLIIYKFLLKYRLVVTFTGMELELAGSSRFSRLKVQLALRVADAVTVVSRDMIDGLKTIFPAAAVHWIPNGVSSSPNFEKTPCEDVEVEGGQFVYCGRLTAVKRVRFLIEAFHACFRQGCRKKLYIVGDGEEAASLQGFVRDLQMSREVIFLGVLPHHQTMAVIEQSLCLVLASSAEGCPMVILEAMSLGRPVIASDVGGVGEIVSHGENGFLFPPDDRDRLCELMMQMAREAGLSRELGLRAARNIDLYHRFETMAQKYLDVYASTHP